MFVYQIKGQAFCDGERVNVDDVIYVGEKSTVTALEQFKSKYSEDIDFNGKLKTCDAKTHGQLGATYIDHNEEVQLDVDFLKQELRFEVFEDNGGGLHFFVFDDDNECIYGHSGYELNPGQLSEDIVALRKGEDPLLWDGCCDDPAADYKSLDESDACMIVVDNMGNAAEAEFGEEPEPPVNGPSFTP